MAIFSLMVVFTLHQAYSLKDKRKVIQSILDMSRRHYRVSATELDFHDIHNQACLGFVTITRSPYQGQEIIEQLFQRIESNYPIQVMQYEIEEH